MKNFTRLFIAVVLSLACRCASYDLPQKVNYDLDSSASLFQNFITKYNKQYSSAESEYRYQVFQENLNRINTLNKEYESAVFGINHFADLTLEEMQTYTSCMFNTSNIQPMHITKWDFPKELDYRKQHLVSEVKNQGGCGSCYIFGAIGDIEGQYAKRTKKIVSLSEQYPLDCGNFTCNGGLPHKVVNWLATTPGPLKTTDSPYLGHPKKCVEDPKKGVARVKPINATSVSNTLELRTLLASHGPLGIAIAATEDFFFYQRGIIKPTNPGGDLNHAVTLIGYGMEKTDRYWLIKNSWGKDWGEDGYMRLLFNRCAVGTYLSPTELV